MNTPGKSKAVEIAGSMLYQQQKEVPGNKLVNVEAFIPRRGDVRYSKITPRWNKTLRF